MLASEIIIKYLYNTKIRMSHTQITILKKSIFSLLHKNYFVGGLKRPNATLNKVDHFEVERPAKLTHGSGLPGIDPKTYQGYVFILASERSCSYRDSNPRHTFNLLAKFWVSGKVATRRSESRLRRHWSYRGYNQLFWINRLGFHRKNSGLCNCKGWYTFGPSIKLAKR